ncbi:MAG: adenylate/guanylate cyclase domain-containing protein, partial [Solirubrobacteraceae bacterium]|nr:adenylate/guanylate cyclase domain-containing protein [Solirubrobacteraceae bacterium]
WDAPLATPRNRRTMAMLERSSSGPGHAQAVFQAAMSADVREVLPLVQAPTRVLHHPGHAAPEASARHVAALIPNATFHQLPSSEPHMTLGSSQGPLFEQLILAAGNGTAVVRTDRQLATILFTDIVGSTQQLIAHGDAAWSVKLEQHEHQIREQVHESGGRLVKMIGDGSLSIFTAPAAAVRCAEQICETAGELGIEVRAGLHTGECERRHGDISGLAVNIAARVAAAAKPSEVLVSQTVADLVMGSGLNFAPRGAYELRGMPERWELLALSGEDLEAVTFDPSPCRMHRADKLRIGAARRAPQLMRRFHRWETQSLRRLTRGSSPSAT